MKIKFFWLHDGFAPEIRLQFMGKNRTVAISAIERKKSKRRREAENYTLYLLTFKFTYI